jgi:LacI family transcriptional regulator
VRISIRDVAKRANVSHATVSRVLNNVDVPIADETRQLVRHIADEMGYRPNRAARALATGRNQSIVLWTVNLQSAYYGDVIYYTHEEVIRHDYEMLISGAPMYDDMSVDDFKLLTWPVDGILAVDLPRGRIPALNKSLVGDKPFINVGAYVITETDYVQVDFEDQAADAVRHLGSVGCKRIAYLVPGWFDWFESINDARLFGYRKAMAELGFQPEYIITHDEKREQVARALRAYLGQNGCADGLFCYNDDMAIAAYPVLQEKGIRIPDDIAVVGCNGIRDTSYLYPALTTIVQPLQQVCATAWTYLRRRIDNPSIPLQQVVLPARLEIRASSRRN